MKTVNRHKRFNGNLLRVWLVAGVITFWASLESQCINAVAPGVVAARPNGAATPTISAARYSAGIADIVKLTDAKVDPEVIKTFIKSSQVAYNPSADELIALKNRGVGSEILSAILQRGGEVRAQALPAGQSSTAATQPYSGGATQYAPAYTASAQPVYASYNYGYPAVSYVTPAYSYAYPSYYYGCYDYSCGWPYYWPWVSFNFGCYPSRGYCGYGYPYWYGGRGCGYYYGHGGYYGRGGYYARGGYYGYPHYAGARGFGGSVSHPVSHFGPVGGFHSLGGGGRSATFTSTGGGFRSGGGFGGHAVSFGGHGGGFGGRGGGRGR
jgi:hypothetical protein